MSLLAGVLVLAGCSSDSGGGGLSKPDAGDLPSFSGSAPGSEADAIALFENAVSGTSAQIESGASTSAASVDASGTQSETWNESFSGTVSGPNGGSVGDVLLTS